MGLVGSCRFFVRLGRGLAIYLGCGFGLGFSLCLGLCLYFGLGFPLSAAWLFFISAAANKGFFINEVPFIQSRLFDVRLLDYVLMASALFILATTITPKLRNTVPLAIAAKIIFFSPLFIIGVQYLRQLLSPNTPLPLWLKVALFVLALCLAALSAKIKFGKRLALANQKLLDRPAPPN